MCSNKYTNKAYINSKGVLLHFSKCVHIVLEIAETLQALNLIFIW